MRKNYNFKKLILVLVLFTFTISFPLVTFARPGGGHSSGGDSHFGPTVYPYHHASSTSLDISSYVLFFIILICFIFAYLIVFKILMNKKKSKTLNAITSLSMKNFNWNYDVIMKDVKNTFYKISIGWMEKNQELCKEYMSENLYNKHKLQTNCMKMRNEKNILENMELIKVIPIGLKYSEDINNDFIWFFIKAKSIDYTINEETNEIINGFKNKHICYRECWKFIHIENKWVLDEIKQIKEVSFDFFTINIS